MCLKIYCCTKGNEMGKKGKKRVLFLWVSGLQYVNTWTYFGVHKNRKIIKKERRQFSFLSTPLSVGRFGQQISSEVDTASVG